MGIMPIRTTRKIVMFFSDDGNTELEPLRFPEPRYHICPLISSHWRCDLQQSWQQCMGNGLGRKICVKLRANAKDQHWNHPKDIPDNPFSTEECISCKIYLE